jgi:hypothetical protein
MVLASCGKSKNEGDAELSQFFRNSTRRDVTEEEASKIARMPNGCTAFFVENTQAKTYVGTAKHCVSDNFNRWCAKGYVTTPGGEKLVCNQILIEDPRRDIGIFEVSREGAMPAERTLKLAAYQPDVKTKLVMLGYPADKYRRGALTATENCWVTKSTVRSPHGGVASDRSSLHNCTTYGGNSGGPMISEGTNEVIGLPFTYAPNDYRLRDPENLGSAAYLAQMADFVEANRKKLDELGVAVQD